MCIMLLRNITVQNNITTYLAILKIHSSDNFFFIYPCRMYKLLLNSVQHLKYNFIIL